MSHAKTVDHLIEIDKLEALPQAAGSFLEAIGDRKLVTFTGEMGTGKTTFIMEVCRQLGTTDAVASPTYSIVNEYHYPGGKIYHIDLYRLNDIGEALEIGIEEYLDSNEFCFIEWPQLIEDILPGKRVDIQMSLGDEGKRKVSIFKV